MLYKITPPTFTAYLQKIKSSCKSGGGGTSTNYDSRTQPLKKKYSSTRKKIKTMWWSITKPQESAMMKLSQSDMTKATPSAMIKTTKSPATALAISVKMKLLRLIIIES